MCSAQPLARQPGGDGGEQLLGEGQLALGVALLAERAAHEAARVLAAREDHFGQHRLVELDERHAGGQEMVQLLAQHAHDVLGQVLARAIHAIGDALDPHEPAQQIRPGQRDLRRPIGQRAHERVLVHAEGTAPSERTEDGRMPDLGGGDVERLQLGAELLGVVDERQEIGQRDELAVVEPAAHEARVVVTALLAVGDHVDAGPELRVDGQAYGVVGGRLEVGVAQPALHVLVHGLRASSAAAASCRCPSRPAGGWPRRARAAAAWRE